MKFSLRFLLMLTSLVLVAVPSVVVGLFGSFQTMKQIINNQELELIENVELVENRITMTKQFTDEAVLKDLSILEIKLKELGGLEISEEIVKRPAVDYSSPVVEIEKLVLADYSIEQIEGVLGSLTKMTGAYFTIFQPFKDGILRISTSIRNEDGKSAKGTYIDTNSNVYKSVADGQTYTGRAVVLGDWFSTVYKPVFSKEGNLMYVLFAGKPESHYFESLFQDLVRKTIGAEGYYYILNTDGHYILSLQNLRDGENIIDATDENGNRFIENIIETAVMKPGVSVIKYPWMNAGEQFPRDKIAAYTFVDELDWVIAASDYMDRANALVLTSIKKQSIIVLVCLIAGMLLAVIMSNLISKTFRAVHDNFKLIAKGDFLSFSKSRSVIKDIDSLQEALIVDMFPTFTELISGIDFKSFQISRMSDVLDFNINQSLDSIERVDNSSVAVRTESEKLSELMTASHGAAESMAQDIAGLKDMISEQSSSVAEISASIEESNASLQNVARVANEKLENAKILQQQGEKGKTFVENTNRLINQIRKDIKLLFEINSIINEITEQSKLLAMNAAIEAAHAGNHGRGFAIVAGEMRNLADTTAENGIKINETLSGILTGIKEASQQSNETQAIITDVTDELTLFIDVFHEITYSTAEISSGTVQILEAANNLSGLSVNTLESSNSINESTTQLADAVKVTAESSLRNLSEIEELTAALGELTVAQNEMKQLGDLNAAMGRELSESLERFKYEKNEAESESMIGIIRAHQIWVEKVYGHISGTQTLDAETITDHNECELGKWLTFNSGLYAGNKTYKALLEIHERMHSAVKTAGRTEGSDSGKIYEEVKKLSHEVIELLLDLIALENTGGIVGSNPLSASVSAVDSEELHS